MIFSLKRYLHIFFLLSFISSLKAQWIPVDHIGVDDGLVSQLCYYILEDDEKNIWISTSQDVHKYDGYSCKVFSDPIKNINSHMITGLDLDQSGNVWVIQGKYSTKNHPLFFRADYEHIVTVIEPKTEIVKSLDEYLLEENIKTKDIDKIMNRNKIFYLKTKENEIYSYTDKINMYAEIENVENFVNIDIGGNLVFLENDTLKIYSKDKDFLNAPGIRIEDRQQIVVGMNGNIFILSAVDKEFTVQEYANGKKNDLITLPLETHWNQMKYNKIKYFGLQQILINENLYDLSNNSKVNDILNKEVYNYIISDIGLAFINSNLGVFVLNTIENDFHQIASNDTEMNSVRGLYTNPDISFFRFNGIESIKSNSDLYNTAFIKDRHLDQQATMHYQDPLWKHCIWSVGYIKKSVRKIDFQNQEFYNYTFEPRNPGYTNGIHRSSISNNLFISSAVGPYILDEFEQTFNKLNFDCLSEEEYETVHIIENNHEIWFSGANGIIQYNEQTQSSLIHPLFDSLAYFIQFMHVDLENENIIWMGTNKKGLLKWNMLTDEITSYTTDDGLSNNDVHAILEDKNGRLWISTNRYLNCFEKENENIYIFTEQNGISHSEFNKFSYFHDTIENHMYFGGLDGYNYFNPDSIITNSTESKIKLRLIDAFKTKDDATIENIFLDTDKNRMLEFDDDDVSIQLNLSTNHLSNTRHIQYSYRIPGLFDEWRTSSKNDITLSRLPYGKYTLEFISDLNKPSYTSQIMTLNLDVIQPFMKSWIGRFLKLLGFLFIVWLLVQQYLKNLKARNIKLEELVTERTQELSTSNETKNKLFAILAHDLRNPISSLTDLTEKINFLVSKNRIEDLKTLADQTKDRISALDDNLNNILLWALSENDMINTKPEKLSLRLEINKVLKLYTSLIASKNINAKIDIDLINQVYVDITVLQTILRNIINNAIKFSYENGIISFRIIKKTKERTVLSVIDNGIGIMNSENYSMDKKSQEINDAGKGSGIGLKLTIELANLSGIKIDFESNASGGTTVLIDMPNL